MLALLAGFGLAAAGCECGHEWKEHHGMKRDADEVKMTLAECPDAVKATLVQESKDGKLVEIVKEDEDGKTVFAADLTVDGKLISKEIEDGKDAQKDKEDDDKDDNKHEGKK